MRSLELDLTEPFEVKMIFAESELAAQDLLSEMREPMPNSQDDQRD